MKAVELMKQTLLRRRDCDSLDEFKLAMIILEYMIYLIAYLFVTCSD